MLGEFWVYLFVVLLGVGFGVRNEVLVIIGAIGLALAGGTWLWSRLAVERLTYQRSLSRHRVFLDEDVKVQMALSNRKRLPLARVRLVDSLPVEVELVGHELKGTRREGVLHFTKSTALGPYERVRWTYTLRPKQRGFFRVGPAQVHTGDMFGFFTRVRYQSEVELLLVFPSTIPLPPLSLSARRPLGDARSGAWFPHANPARPAGVREYVPGDPPKYIDWKASARRGTLQVKQFEPGASEMTALFVNADTVGVSYGGVIPLHLERAVAVAASLAEGLLVAEHPIALYTNSRSVLVEHPMRVPPGRQPQQHTLVMETLAMAGPYLACRIEDLMLEQARRLPGGATLVLITAMMTPELSDALELLVRMRRNPLVVWVAAWDPEELPQGITLINLAQHLKELEAQGLAPYTVGLQAARAGPGEEGREGAEAEAATRERAHLEARDVPMA